MIIEGHREVGRSVIFFNLLLFAYTSILYYCFFLFSFLSNFRMVVADFKNTKRNKKDRRIYLPGGQDTVVPICSSCITLAHEKIMTVLLIYSSSSSKSSLLFFFLLESKANSFSIASISFVSRTSSATSSNFLFEDDEEYFASSISCISPSS